MCYAAADAGLQRQTGDFEISDAAAFAWRIGLTGRQLIGILSVGDLAESIYDALDFCYKGTETTVLSRLMDLGVCTASAANALGLLNKDYTARQLADRCLSAAFQLSLYETEEQVHDEVSSADASGFFISADGLAVTNYHSIEDSIKATATLLNGETYEVERVLYYDTGIDIAVIKVSRTNQSRRTTSAFNHLDLVGTADIRPGDPVYAIGNPLGVELRGTLTNGIVSAINRDVYVDGVTMTLIQTNAALNNGNSGGPLINVYGQVVGINTMKMGSSSTTSVEGLGFAIPIASTAYMINDLIAYGEVHGEVVIGISVQIAPVTAENGESALLVMEVTPGGPGEEAGIQKGDLIVAADGEALTKSTDLLRVRRRHEAGETLKLLVERDGKRFTADVVLRESDT